MPEERESFRCPLCGMYAYIENLTEEGPYPLESWAKKLGGSLPLTTKEREARTGRVFKKGSGKPIFSWDSLAVTPELRALVQKRIEEISEI